MRARFVGDANGHGPDSVKLFGQVWTKGKAMDVPAGFEDKIAGNTHFEEVKPRGKASAENVE